MPGVGGGAFVSLFFTCVYGTWKTVLNFSGTRRVRLISLLLVLLLLLLLLTRWRRRRWRAARAAHAPNPFRPTAKSADPGGRRRTVIPRQTSAISVFQDAHDDRHHITLFHRKRAYTLIVGRNKIVRKENYGRPNPNKLKTVRRRLTHITVPGSNTAAAAAAVMRTYAALLLWPLAAFLVTRTSGSAIPMWEFLSRGEKVTD